MKTRRKRVTRKGCRHLYDHLSNQARVMTGSGTRKRYVPEDYFACNYVYISL